MILRLDPRLPLVWRSPISVQFGIDPPVVRLDEVTETQERLIAALVVGVSEPGLDMIAQGRLVERDALLAAVAPALVTRVAPATVATVAISGTEPLVTATSAVLAESGVSVHVAADAADLAESRPDFAIVVGQFVLAPELHGLWLRRDVPHLPVVVSDSAVEIGPIVEPGDGPCLLCIELHRRDADAAWPAIATQLLGRRSRGETAVLVAEAAATTARIALERLAGGVGGSASVRIDAATGARSYRLWAAHPECGCRGIPGLLEPSAAAAG